MVRVGYALGVKLPVWVACAGIVTLWLTVTGVPPPGGVMVALTWPVWAVLVLLVMSVLTVSAELLRSAVLFSITCALPSDSAPSSASWTGNWMPVLLSGGIWFQSTSSRVNMVLGLFGLTSMASEFVPVLTSLVRLKLNLVYVPGTVAEGPTSWPLTHTFPEPTPPLTTSVATPPASTSALNSIPPHH